MLELDDVGVLFLHKHSHDLKLSILEALVLKNLHNFWSTVATQDKQKM